VNADTENPAFCLMYDRNFNWNCYLHQCTC